MEDPTRRGQRRTSGAERERQSDGSAMKYAGVGLQFAVSILLFLYAGQWLDRRFGTAPWLMMLGVFVGGGASFYSMYRRLMADQAREEAERREELARRDRSADR
jgi:F0F1-type ATP synthase assembly protein I